MEGSQQPISSLLRPRYRSLLRIRSRRSCIFKFGTNFSLIVCFAICLCAAAYMENIMEDILQNDQYSAEIFKNHASVSVLKAILENRGIESENLVERQELESAIQATGHLTAEEIRFAERVVINDNNEDVHPDAALYDEVLGRHTTAENHSSNTAISIVFNSESEFIERVDDNKDSVWLLVVVAAWQGSSGEVIFGQVWGSMVQRYSPFGVKMGILDCNRLQSICLDRGLIAVDLVLAVPRGGDRIKDSVQFRPFLLQTLPKPPYSTQTPVDLSHRKSVIMKTVHNWLTSVLAERVRPVRSAEDILPVSSVLLAEKGPRPTYRLRSHWSYWFTRSPQPVHFIWLRSAKSSEMRYLDAIPLVISALSVPFTGRIRFWTLDVNNSLIRHSTHNADTDSSGLLPVSVSSVSSPIDLVHELGCSPNATYLFITPESFCFTFASSSRQGQKEFLNYALLELYLRFFYPSVDDLLFILVCLVNISVLLSSAVTAGRFITATHLSLQHSVINSTFNGQTVPPNPTVLITAESLNTMDHAFSRLRMIQSLVDFARRGWTAYTPAVMRQSASANEPIPASSSPAHINTMHFSRRSTLFRIFLRWIGNVFSDLFYANLILLVAILPVINILSFSYFSCVINLFLLLLRVLVTCSPLLKLRSSLSTSLAAGKTLAAITCLLWCLVALASTYYTLHYARYPASPTSQSRRRRRPTATSVLSGPGASTLDAFWADLTRMLVVSDMENRTERTTSTASTSSTDLDPPTLGLPVIDQHMGASSSASSPGEQTAADAAVVSSPVGFDPVEHTRLLRRLNQLHQLLSLRSNVETETPASVIPAPTAPSTNSYSIVGNMTGLPGELAVSSAHIYTWRYLCNSARRGHDSGVEEQCSSVEQKFEAPESADGSPSGRSYPPRSVHPHKQLTGLPSTSRRRRASQNNQRIGASESDYEAGDELDESSDNLNSPVIKADRTAAPHPYRIRRRQRTRALGLTTVQLSGDSSSDADNPRGEEPTKEDVGGGTTTDHSDAEQSGVDASSPSVFPDWPSWVIACRSCVVCRRSFRSPVRLGALPCGHAFHEACVRRWLDTGALHCPLCRWPAYAPHLRQQREMISQLITTVRSTLNTNASPRISR